MKKIISLLLLFVSCRVGVQQFHLISKVGLNLVNTTEEMDSKVYPGLNVGLGDSVMLTERFGVEAGVHHLIQGSKYNGNEVSYTDKLDCISISVYAKEFIYKGLYLFGGPQLSFNVNFKNKVSSDHATAVMGMSVIRTLDRGAGPGIGYQSKYGLLVSLNRNIGLINVNKAWANNSNPKASNSVVQLSVGWRLTL